MEPIDYRAKLMALQDRAQIELDDSYLVGEDMHHNIWGSSCRAVCRSCEKQLVAVSGQMRVEVYKRAGEAILAHSFSCTQTQQRLLI